MLYSLVSRLLLGRETAWQLPWVQSVYGQRSHCLIHAVSIGLGAHGSLLPRMVLRMQG